MKRLTLLIAAVLLVTASVFAGDIPAGGRTCPEGQTTCLVTGEDRESDKVSVPKADIPVRWLFVQEMIRYLKIIT